MSKISSLPGRKRITCRHSSLPMEPPPPVTSTVLPVRYPEIRSVSSVTSSRERKSAVFSSRNAPCGAAAPTSCGSLSSCTGQWVLTQRSMTWFSLLPRSVGMAMMMLWMLYRVHTSGISSSVPFTGTPWMVWLRLAGSSSTAATGRPYSLLDLQTLMAQAPASPAPTISTGRLGSFFALPRSCSPSGWFRNSRQARRLPPTSRKISTAAMQLAELNNTPWMHSRLTAYTAAVGTAIIPASRSRSRSPAYFHSTEYSPPPRKLRRYTATIQGRFAYRMARLCGHQAASTAPSARRSSAK